jgi:hypothetical protein
MVNTAQQVGGSVGTALLSTLSANAITSYLSTRTPSKIITSQATIYGYHVDFAIVAHIGGFLFHRQPVRAAHLEAAGPKEDLPANVL